MNKSSTLKLLSGAVGLLGIILLAVLGCSPVKEYNE